MPEVAPTNPAPVPVPAVSGTNGAPGAAVVPSAGTFPYTVKTGETLDDIARNFGVPKQDIMSLNGITDAASVTAGQQIKVPQQP